MAVSSQLVLADLRRRPGRLAVTLLAVVASAAVVVWVVSGYDAMRGSIESVGPEYLGRCDAVVAHEAFPAKLLGGLRDDPDVERLDDAFQSQAVLIGPKGIVPSDPAQQRVPEDEGYGGEEAYIDGDGSAASGRHAHDRPPVAVGTRAPTPPRGLVEGAWLSSDPRAPEAVLCHDLAERVGAVIGKPLTLRVGKAEREVRVVGTVQELLAATVVGETVAGPRGRLLRSRGAGPAGEAIYVRRELLQDLVGGPVRPNLASVYLKPEADADAFAQRWRPQLAAATPPAQLVTRADIRTALAEGATTRAARVQSYAATAISLLAALFIIFSTLSMGVSERMRQFAVLRAVGLTRGQVAQVVTLEALILGLLGWLGGLGAGWALLGLAAWGQPDVFGGDVAPGAWSVGLSGVCALAGALVASLLPAWTAARVDIVTALSQRPAAAQRRWLRPATLAGLALAALAPVLLHAPLPLEDKTRSILVGALGIPALAAGSILICPALILITEAALGPLLARVLILPPGLLRSQLSSNLPRTVGTTGALTIGLGLFVTIQVWGSSMLGPFLPGTWAPPAMVSIATCIPAEELQDLDAGTAPRVVPLAVEQPRLADDITGARSKGTSVVRQDSVILVGGDPEQAFVGERPLFDLRFVDGDPASALAKLRQGMHVIVPDHFVAATGVGLGGRFKVIPPDEPTRSVEYTVAGVVRLPGWHFVTKEAGLRRRFPRAAALMFTDLASLQKAFSLETKRIDLLGVELAPGSGELELRAVLEPVAANYIDPRSAGKGLSVMTPDAIRSSLRSRTAAILWGASQLPLITLLVTSLGVMNAIVASLRARRWELGVLRAIGVTRSALVRVVLGEAALIGVVACALSLGFGFTAAWCGVGVAEYVSFFGGMAPDMVVPWSLMAGGIGATLILCLLAGIYPAVSISRTPALELLQAGRSFA